MRLTVAKARGEERGNGKERREGQKKAGVMKRCREENRSKEIKAFHSDSSFKSALFVVAVH